MLTFKATSCLNHMSKSGLITCYHFMYKFVAQFLLLWSSLSFVCSLDQLISKRAQAQVLTSNSRTLSLMDKFWACQIFHRFLLSSALFFTAAMFSADVNSRSRTHDTKRAVFLASYFTIFSIISHIFLAKYLEKVNKLHGKKMLNWTPQRRKARRRTPRRKNSNNRGIGWTERGWNRDAVTVVTKTAYVYSFHNNII